LAAKTQLRDGSIRVTPSTRTLTPVVRRISQAHARAQRCAKSPERSNRVETSDAAPRTIVYRLTAGMR
jgi:hypothetical protein